LLKRAGRFGDGGPAHCVPAIQLGWRFYASPGKTEGDVLRYLNGGLFMPEIEEVFLRVNPGPASATEPALATPTGNAYVDKYISIRKAAMGDFPKGYKVARIGTPDFNLLAARDGQVNPNFPLIRTAGLGEAYEGDPGSSLA
jgi:hypothetical protein